jgi:hypothetical protein
MFEQAFKNIDDILWKEAGCTTELDHTEQTSWFLFLLSLLEVRNRIALIFSTILEWDNKQLHDVMRGSQ